MKKKPKNTFFNIKTTALVLLLVLVFFAIITFSAYAIIQLYLPNIRFGNEKLAWLLLVPVFLSILYIYGFIIKNKGIRKYTNLSLSHFRVSNFSFSKILIKRILLIGCFFFIALAIINPRIGNKKEEIKLTGLDIMICLDVSNSMLAEDLKPNRLERAKQSIHKLLNNLRGDKIGMIVFAGDAYVQLPITADYAAARLFLDYIDTDIVPVQGTAIGTAINLAMDSFDPKSKAGKTIIVITDGENHEDDAAEVAAEAKKENIVVNFIGLGSLKGEVIPVYRGGRRVDFKKDNEGNVILTRLNEATLIKAAKAGGGVYAKASNATLKLERITEDMRSGNKSERDSFIYADFEDRFQVFILLALLFFCVEMLINSVHNKYWNNEKKESV